MAARRRFVGVEFGRPNVVLGGQVLLLLGIHQLAVGLVVPPHVAEVAVEDVRTGVNVADHALAGRDPQFKLVLNRMARLVLANHRVDVLDPLVALGGGRAPVAVLGQEPAGGRIAIIGVQHVAGTAATAAVVARRDRWSRESSRSDPSSRVFAKPMNTGSVRFSVPSPRLLNRSRGRPGSSRTSGMPNFGSETTAPFKDPQHVARLADLVGDQRLQKRQHSLVLASLVAVGGGTVCRICGVPFMLYDSPKREYFSSVPPLL